MDEKKVTISRVALIPFSKLFSYLTIVSGIQTDVLNSIFHKELMTQHQLLLVLRQESEAGPGYGSTEGCGWKKISVAKIPFAGMDLFRSLLHLR